MVSAKWVALAHVALLLFQTSRHKSVSVETRLASLAVESSSVIDATKTFSSRPVTVPDGTWVHVPIAIALLARPGSPVKAVGISEVAVLTHLTSRTSPTLGTFRANRRLGVARNLVAHAGPQVACCVLNLWAGAWLARAVVSREGVSEVAWSADVTLVASGVVLALANA